MSGQAITGSQGTIIALGGDGNVAMTGTDYAFSLGTPVRLSFTPLKSRKVGGGTATFALTGASGTSELGTLTYLGQAILGWNANSESDLAGYRIYHGTASGVYDPNPAVVGLVTSYTWPALAPHQTHYFAVTAFDTSNNESLKSLEASKAY